ncbi:MAG: protein phosphatase 2C domain-containing protein [Nitrospirae bacterium]|uniref:PP2C family serine/threonine-protein phosphatase n=1 Tax=Candidatus Magnetobacterium casense TaxID=1455061 RepID=UPI00058EA0B3|nr:PP2C family serine/threonine-protein phosphatase [Candidatus Magnetobacterium casensis]MBF0338470.1 protein phosphatase 2C domain-containing protein [Nitrospirota bacterium]
MTKALKPPYIFGASVIGPLHVPMGIPCQDACAYEVFKDIGLIAVADGLGSAPKSDIGSRQAVDAAIEAAKQHLVANDNGEHSLGELTGKMILSAREQIEKTAEKDGYKLRDLATTLIVSAFVGGSVSIAHIGDGAVIAKTDKGLILASAPEESEYANEVVPLTSNKWNEHTHTSSIKNASFIALFTDGCQRAALKKSPLGYEPFNGFFDPVCSYAIKIEEIESANEEIKALLSSPKMNEHSDDDKTLVIAILKTVRGNSTDGYSDSI